MSTTATIEISQSLLDIAMQYCGSIESLFNLAGKNNISITDELKAGEELTLATVVTKSIVESIALELNKPATAITSTDYNETIAQEGIEFWAIEMDFVVS